MTARKVKTRAYHSRARAEAAAQTRRAIVQAARDLFVRKGYAGVTMADIAERAGVALDTVYAVVGKKHELFVLLLESAISGTDHAVEAQQRDYVIAIKREPKAREKLRIYARAVGAIAPRLAPLHSALKEAASAEPQLADAWRKISSRRAENMRLFAADLFATGSLREDLNVERVADVIWSMNGPEYYSMLVSECGWSVEQFTTWLYDAWCRLLLRGKRRRVEQQ
jgi:AcrR family transcriptional regulator